jgi:hypothetical protein
LSDDSSYVDATWNADGTIQSIKYNMTFSTYRTATYVYQNGRIVQAILYDNLNKKHFDTALFHYNAAGLVDSVYLKNENWNDAAFRYINGKLSKCTRYSGGRVYSYWDFETDAKGNVTKASEWWYFVGGLSNVSVETYSRDDRKNPFKDLAPFLFYLDRLDGVFRLWGPNNYNGGRHQLQNGEFINKLTFSYNSNCYPGNSHQTMSGEQVYTDQEFQYSYY